MEHPSWSDPSYFPPAWMDDWSCKTPADPEEEHTTPLQTSSSSPSQQEAEAQSSEAIQSTSMATTIPKKPFRFLDLPPELRNRIYTECLVIPPALLLTTFGMRTGWEMKLSTFQSGRLWPRLLATSKQINDEATSVLYGDNVFKFVGNSPLVPDFLKGTGQYLKHISQVDITGIENRTEFTHTLEALIEATGLERLVMIRAVRDPLLLDLLVPLIRALREARQGQDKKKKALDVLEFPGESEAWLQRMKYAIDDRLRAEAEGLIEQAPLERKDSRPYSTLEELGINWRRQ